MGILNSFFAPDLSDMLGTPPSTLMPHPPPPRGTIATFQEIKGILAQFPVLHKVPEAPQRGRLPYPFNGGFCQAPLRHSLAFLHANTPLRQNSFRPFQPPGQEPILQPLQPDLLRVEAAQIPLIIPG